MQSDGLVRMVNQIAGAFAAKPDEAAIAAIAEHLRLFWDPRMRRAIAAHMANGGEGLTARAKSAVLTLQM